MQSASTQLKQNTSNENIFKTQTGFQLSKALLGLDKMLSTHLSGDIENVAPLVDMSDILMDSPAYELAVKYMKTRPEVANIIQERYSPSSHNLDTLLQYPKDSLGYVYASTLKKTGYEPGFHPYVDIESDANYIEFRIRQTHDIWHIITGFDTSVVGEVGLDTFYIAQCHLPFSHIAVASFLITAIIREPEKIADLHQAIKSGWEMGVKAKPLLAQKWEEAWFKPVRTWRQAVDIVPVTEPS